MNKHECKGPLHHCGDTAECNELACGPSINRDEDGDGGETGRGDDSAGSGVLISWTVSLIVTFFPAGSSPSKALSISIVSSLSLIFALLERMLTG